jgi:hypothetical protein
MRGRHLDNALSCCFFFTNDESTLAFLNFLSHVTASIVAILVILAFLECESSFETGVCIRCHRCNRDVPYLERHHRERRAGESLRQDASKLIG